MCGAGIMGPSCLSDFVLVLALEPHLHDDEGRQDLCAAIPHVVEVLAFVMVRESSRVTPILLGIADHNLAAGLLRITTQMGSLCK